MRVSDDVRASGIAVAAQQRATALIELDARRDRLYAERRSAQFSLDRHLGLKSAWKRNEQLTPCASRYDWSGDGRRKGRKNGDAFAVHLMREHNFVAANKQFGQRHIQGENGAGCAHTTGVIATFYRQVLVGGTGINHAHAVAIRHSGHRH